MPIVIPKIEDQSKFPIEKKPSLDPNQKEVYSDVFSLQNAFRILFHVLNNMFGAIQDYINTNLLEDAPADGTTYGRKDHAWVPTGGGGGGGGPLVVPWGDISSLGGGDAGQVIAFAAPTVPETAVANPSFFYLLDEASGNFANLGTLGGNGTPYAAVVYNSGAATRQEVYGPNTINFPVAAESATSGGNGVCSQDIGAGTFGPICTVCCWVHFPAGNIPNCELFSTQDPGGFNIMISAGGGGAPTAPGRIFGMGQNAIAWRNDLFPLPFTTAGWHHVAVVWNGSTSVTTYIDGDQMHQATTWGNYNAGTPNCRVGRGDNPYPIPAGSGIKLARFAEYAAALPASYIKILAQRTSQPIAGQWDGTALHPMG